MTKNKTKNEVISIDDNEQYRVCIDLKAQGNAEGGKFINVKGLKDMIEGLEEKEINKMVGLVYDGTDRLEILTQNINNNGGVRGVIQDAKIID
jgi:hypothetical protein|tara:strand:+ start:4513 stop:4791 length:279 start_codon:yes stop_codon:yes gene_type:complete